MPKQWDDQKMEWQKGHVRDSASKIVFANTLEDKVRVFITADQDNEKSFDVEPGVTLELESDSFPVGYAFELSWSKCDEPSKSIGDVTLFFPTQHEGALEINSDSNYIAALKEDKEDDDEDNFSFRRQ